MFNNSYKKTKGDGEDDSMDVDEEGSEPDDSMDYDEDGDGDGGAMGYDEGLEIKDEELEMLKKKKRWRIKEEEVRAKHRAEQEEKRRRMKGHQGKQDVENIFTGTAASGVLTNDLISIMQNAKKLGYTAKPVDDNIYEWEIHLFGFEPNCSIQSDLIAIQEKFGYDHVALRVSFKMDLYPFYPPLVKLIRPRFRGFMMGRITSSEMFKLENWDPVKDMKFYIQSIRSLLEKYGSIDTTNFMNDMDRYPEGAYTELEYLLLEIELLTDKDPRANLKYPQPDWVKKEKAAVVAKREEAEKEKTTNKDFWARGTGYGHEGKSSWNVAAYLAAQRERDLEVERVLAAISREIRKTAQMPPQFLASATNMLEESCLVPLLESYLANDSLLDLNRHSSLYGCVFDLMRAVAEHKQFRVLVDKLEHQKTSLYELMTRLNQQAQIYSKTVSSAGGSSTDEDAVVGDITATFHVVDEAYRATVSHKKKGPGAVLASASSSSSSGETSTLESKYASLMAPMQFDYADILSSTYPYIYRKESASDGLKAAKDRVLRLAQEHSSLSQSLPLNSESTVFIRVDSNRMDVMTCLITGPLDTPYAGGCFIFDIFFPGTYPGSPPLVNIATTGNQSVRFNPNLYNTGKVCLSLLGTWSGAEGETWNKDTSTLLQVVVSIQSLILVPQPYFNEPGYERSMNTPQGDQQSRAYNENIKEQSIKWAILDQLRNPKLGFERVIQGHFFVLRDKITEVIRSWIADPKASAAHKLRLESQLKDVQTEFAKLTEPAPKPDDD
jgi:baculoviral IAP repeat-containing protein 6 (apollon)